MKDNKVWVLVELPPNGKIVGSKWLFKKKTDIDGVVHTYKARPMAKGYTQTPWIDYEKTFSPVADIRAIRILIAIAAYYDYEIWQMDFKTDFLNGYLNEEVYMEQPEGFVNPKYPNRRYCMENFKRGGIPMQEKLKLSKSQGASTPAELKRIQNVPYASAVGDLKRELNVSCYTDAGYLTDADDLKSQTGYLFVLNGGAVDWKSAKKSIFATSSAEVEYIVAFDASKEAVWVRNFISGLGVVPIIEEPISMYCDNTGAIAIANESGITKGARHFRAKVDYLREVIEYGDVKLEKVHTDDSLADPFTKALAFPKHFEHTRNIGMLPASSLIGDNLVTSFIIIAVDFKGVLIYKARVWAYRKVSDNINFQLFENVGPRAFSYAELEILTDGFKEELGRGSFGIVYKGIIESSMKVVAVKKLKEELAQQREIEFQTEMKVIGRTHHRNLAKLLGYCCEGSERLLVFEYMPQGSLADILFEPIRNTPCWAERIRMAIDIAHGILYLHEECETAIIHCDIQPQNILMDKYNCAKISDFGLAKLLEHDQTRTSTLIRGTRGYVAPEWYKNLHVTVKVDVYSFGIVLFEILCCRMSVESNFPVNEAILEEWVYDCYEADELSKLVDGEDVDKRTLDRMVKIGLWCIQEDPDLRPSMKKVVLMLEGTLKIPVPPNPASFLSVV
nr:G-type lectin S-receptor-like serine/threonine-protein kinase LECRK3 [Tanacetum cinerariifolium]